MAAARTSKSKRPLGGKALGYDATNDTARRRHPPRSVSAEHVILPDSKRRTMLATAQDQQRNASVAAWMIRRHIDYVSKFKLQFRTGNEKLDNLMNRIFDWHAQPRNFDIAERFGREEMFRMFEMEKVVAGDAFLIKLASMKLQAVESDMVALPRVVISPETGRIHNVPPSILKQVDKQGLVFDRTAPGRVAKYCICNRGPDGAQVAYDHLEDAENIIFDGYFTRFSSQVRGISPLSAVINTVQDIYEGVDLNLAKAKVHAIFGLALMHDYTGGTSDQEEMYSMGGASGLAEGASEAAESATETDAGTKKISATLQQIKPSDMLLVDMETKGRIELLESRTPSTEFRDFTSFVIRLSLLALDIPYSAFDSKSASFSGMIADQNLYEVACRAKREKNLWKRIEYSDWLLETIWNENDENWPLRKVAAEFGITRLRDLQALVEWVPAGFPWLQKLQEVQGDVKAISIGLDNPIDACKRRGGDFFDNILKIEQANTFAEQHGVVLMIGEPGQQSVEQIKQDTDEPDGKPQPGEEEGA